MEIQQETTPVVVDSVEVEVGMVHNWEVKGMLHNSEELDTKVSDQLMDDKNSNFCWNC